MKKTESDGKCVFLDDSRCTVYEIRPVICRFYPFELKNLGNDQYSFSFTTKCEGIGEGSQLGKNFFANLFRVATQAMDEDSKSD
jgi:Fe-S-cluster containining protein